MLVLYHGSGARDFQIVAPGLPEPEWAKIRAAACRLLEKRGELEAAEHLRTIPFEPFNGTNYFGDDFPLLVATVSIDRYADLGGLSVDDEERRRFRHVAKALEEVGHWVRFIAIAADTSNTPQLVSPPVPAITAGSVERALREAEILFQSAGAASAVDRAHTAIHAYLREVCDRANLPYAKDPGVSELFKLIRERHPNFTSASAHEAEVTRIGRAIATILDSANTLRNRASGAHPSNTLLEQPEAILVINAIRTLLHYLDAKLK